MARRLTEKQKQDITKLFISGINIDQLSKQFNFAKLTISRNLKKNLGKVKYEELLVKGTLNKSIDNKKEINKSDINENTEKENINTNKNDIKKVPIETSEEELFKMSQFLEIVPLNCDIENSPQKDLSSVPISDIEFPKIVFMVVDKKVELEIKYLKDYSKWQFLSEDELKRKTIEIYGDLKIAKSFCSKEQKVIKVPNTDVFKLVAPILKSRGISRIISSDKLIAL